MLTNADITIGDDSGGGAAYRKRRKGYLEEDPIQL